MKKIIFALLIFILLSFTSCQNNSIPPQVLPLENENSIFGIGYVTLKPGFSELYSKTGVKWIKFPDVRWEYIETRGPKKGKHDYRWLPFDTVVKDYQDYGFNIQMVISSKCFWAEDKPFELKELVRTEGIVPTFPPKEEFLDDYGDFVYETVERYDGDGIKDMAYLKYPVLYYEIEPEGHNKEMWKGSAEEYLKLLEYAYKAVKRASPDAEVILSGINFGDLFDDSPSEEEIEERFEKISSKKDFIVKTLQSDYYDIIDLHWERDYKSIYSIIKWIRKYSDKPVWAGDAGSAPWILSDETDFNPLYPGRGEEIFNLITEDREYEKWFRAEQARLTAKKFITGMDCGLDRIFVETTSRWMVVNENNLWKNWYLQNMANNDLSVNPVFYTLKLLAEKLDNYRSIKKLEIDPLIYACEIEREGKVIYCLWLEDGLNQSPPGENEKMNKAISLKDYITSDSVKITHMIETDGQIEPEIELSPTDKINITESPIFVEIGEE